MNKFICHKRFKDKAICGNVNIPRGMELESVNGFIQLNGKIICRDTSENACQYFAINNDKKGMERGDYTSSIQRILSNRDDNYQKRWDKLWNDTTALNLRRKDYDDYWLWDVPFYQASIEDLQHILSLIKEA